MSATEHEKRRAEITAERDAIYALVARHGPIAPCDLLQHLPRLTVLADQHFALAWHLDILFDQGRLSYHDAGPDGLRTVAVVR